MTRSPHPAFLRRPVNVVLGAGGVKGVAHIGAIRCFEEFRLKVSCYWGASVGSLVAAFASNGYTAAEMHSIFLSEEFRRPGWEIWSRMLHLLNPMAWLLKPLEQFWAPPGGLIDLKPWFEHICRVYDLKPNERLKIVACDALTGKPVVFAGDSYDLPAALAASGAVAGVFASQLLPETQAHSDPMGIGPFGAHVLIDSFYYRQIPADLVPEPAIVSKLGRCTALPTEPLFPADFFLHLKEMFEGPLIDAVYPDPQGDHLIVDTGMPEVSGMSFGLSQRKLQQQTEYGYRQMKDALEAIAA